MTFTPGLYLDSSRVWTHAAEDEERVQVFAHNHTWGLYYKCLTIVI
jgi:hypothetical protein